MGLLRQKHESPIWVGKVDSVVSTQYISPLSNSSSYQGRMSPLWLVMKLHVFNKTLSERNYTSGDYETRYECACGLKFQIHSNNQVRLTLPDIITGQGETLCASLKPQKDG